MHYLATAHTTDAGKFPSLWEGCPKGGVGAPIGRQAEKKPLKKVNPAPAIVKILLLQFLDC